MLVEQAGHPTIGPLLAAQVAVLISASFIIMSVITLLLAIFPGKEQRSDSEHDDDHAVGIMDSDEPDEPEFSEGESDEHLSPVVRERTDEEIIAALKKAATKQATARLAAERLVEQTAARVTYLEDQIAAFRDGTAPEVKAMQARAREEANRDAMQKVRELGEASERLAQALKDSRARAEEELSARERELRDLRESLPTMRHQIAVDEHRRLRIAVEAIHATPGDDLNERQRQAVAVHVARVRDAMHRLDPDPDVDADAETAFSPDGLRVPPMAQGAGRAALSDDKPNGTKKRTARRWRSRRD